jgi:membrane-bound serine protease (ClpP class)
MVYKPVGSFLPMRILYFLFLLAGIVLAVMPGITGGQDAAPVVYVLRVDGTVNPSLATYIDRGITKAEEDGVSACIVELNTPGGLLSSTEVIISRIMQAQVPVIVYVPPGSWAASAGAFITLAADVAAMGPGSVIGASTPIGGGGEELSEDERNKAIELALTWMKSIAEERGRNEEAAITAVTQAASFSPGEARGTADLSASNQERLGVTRLDPPLIDDAGARDIHELLDRLAAGITLANGENFQIAPRARVVYVDMTTLERFMLAISDPNIAYILLSIGMLGVLVELFHPGTILPGVFGGACLLLGIYSLGVLEANYAGVILMVLAFALFVAEIFTPTFGLLFIGGLVALVIGSLLLFTGTPFEVSPWLIAVVVTLVSAAIIFIVVSIIAAHRRPVSTGREGLVGRIAVARSPLTPKGTVFVEGELWSAAVEDGKVEVGEEVIVTKVEGLLLKVVKKSK